MVEDQPLEDIFHGKHLHQMASGIISFRTAHLWLSTAYICAINLDLFHPEHISYPSQLKRFIMIEFSGNFFFLLNK